MKAEKLLDELIELARTAGYSVRREVGSFRGGACIVKDQQLIIINRSMPHEAAAVILARALAKLQVDDGFVKPAVREILTRERLYVEKHPDVSIVLKTEAA